MIVKSAMKQWLMADHGDCSWHRPDGTEMRQAIITLIESSGGPTVTQELLFGPCFMCGGKGIVQAGVYAPELGDVAQFSPCPVCEREKKAISALREAGVKVKEK